MQDLKNTQKTSQTLVVEYMARMHTPQAILRAWLLRCSAH